MFCRSCRVELPPQARFCHRCGVAVPPPVVEPVPGPTQWGGGWGMLAGSVLVSLVLSGVLSALTGGSWFLLGLLFPLGWWWRGRARLR